MGADRIVATNETDPGAVEAEPDPVLHERLGEALDAWEQECGCFSDAELDAAAATLGVTTKERT